MSNIINLQSIGGYHFGNFYHLKPFIGHYFEEIKSKTDMVNKATIIQIEHKPDANYLSSDGYIGNCWVAIVSDSREINGNPMITYNFRNFRDLVIHYEKEGFKLV